jgi:hypothetical protein
MVNQQFRRDYWVKGPRKLSPLEQSEGLRAQKLVLVSHRPDVSLKVNGSLGEATMSDAIYNPVLDLMADHKPRTFGQIEQAVHGKGVNFAQLSQAVMLLAGISHLAAVQDDVAVGRSKKHTDKLNAHLMDKARGSNDMSYLASPLTGGGYTVGRFQQLFLLAMKNSRKQPADWAQFAWQILAAQGQKLVKEGRTLDSAEENIAELSALARAFAEKQLPILNALQIA